MPEFLQKLFGLDGRIAVVIGGTGVLGGELCNGLAQAGAMVVVAGRSEERGRARVAEIEKLGGEATFSEVDATDCQSLKSLLEAVVKQHGRVDALINFAGVNS